MFSFSHVLHRSLGCSFPRGLQHFGNPFSYFPMLSKALATYLPPPCQGLNITGLTLFLSYGCASITPVIFSHCGHFSVVLFYSLYHLPPLLLQLVLRLMFHGQTKFKWSPRILSVFKSLGALLNSRYFVHLSLNLYVDLYVPFLDEGFLFHSSTKKNKEKSGLPRHVRRFHGKFWHVNCSADYDNKLICAIRQAVKDQRLCCTQLMLYINMPPFLLL